MNVRGAVFVVVRGPADKVEAVLATMRKAGLFAEKSVRGPGTIEVFFHGGDSRPSPAFMDACTAQVAKAAIGTDFVVEETGTIDSEAASRQLAYDRRSGEWLGAFLDTDTPPERRRETLARLAAERGIAVEDIELRDPPEFRLPPE
ncbi:hypothetical protein [Streptomyces daliensis]